MTIAQYRIFGIGSDNDDLHYIGWTQRSLDEEKEQIFSEVAESGSMDIADWVKQARDGGQIDIFEIELAPSAEDARDSASFWCEYYRTLGINVVTGRC